MLSLGNPERSVASVSRSDRTFPFAEPSEVVIDADQNLVDALLHIFDEEIAIAENECFVPISETHMIPLQPH